MSNHLENVNAAFQKELQSTQTVMSGLTASAESHEATLEMQRVDFSAYVYEHQVALENHCLSISGWAQNITSEVQQCHQDFDTFLDAELQIDMPTGDTPKRREFSYPRVLAATSPKERILARFREATGPIIRQDPITEDASCPTDSAGASSNGSSSDKTLKDVPSGSTSCMDLPSAADSILNIADHSEPELLKQRENKENSMTGAIKKYHSDDLQHMKKGRTKNTSSWKAHQSHN